jgi:hypothetical protein
MQRTRFDAEQLQIRSSRSFVHTSSEYVVKLTMVYQYRAYTLTVPGGIRHTRHQHLSMMDTDDAHHSIWSGFEWAWCDRESNLHLKFKYGMWIVPPQPHTIKSAIATSLMSAARTLKEWEVTVGRQHHGGPNDLPHWKRSVT